MALALKSNLIKIVKNYTLFKSFFIQQQYYFIACGDNFLITGFCCHTKGSSINDVTALGGIKDFVQE